MDLEAREIIFAGTRENPSFFVFVGVSKHDDHVLLKHNGAMVCRKIYQANGETFFRDAGKKIRLDREGLEQARERLKPSFVARIMKLNV